MGGVQRAGGPEMRSAAVHAHAVLLGTIHDSLLLRRPTAQQEVPNILMMTTDKRLKLEEKMNKHEESKVEIAAASEDSKMLTLKMEEFDDNARMTMQALHLRMSKHLKEQPETTEKEAAEKVAPTE